jgi:copper chaperone NosL
MRKGIVLAAVLCFAVVAHVAAQEDIAKHGECKYCGMDRGKFAHSRVLIEYDDGTSVGTCSIHCAAIDLAINIDRTPKTIWVAELDTKQLIDSEKAFWVVGGSKMGVMTQRGKWAFGNAEAAGAFMAVNNGGLSSFEQAMKAAYEDMFADTKMIRTKRLAKKHKQD